jgi:hypothetical protein
VGDRIEAARNVLGNLNILVFRDDALLVGIGNLVMEPLGSVVAVTPNGKSGFDKRLAVRVADTTREFVARESASIGGYDLYVDNIEPVALSIASNADAVVVNSARRSAVLMGLIPHTDYLLRGERHDGTYLRSGHEIP